MKSMIKYPLKTNKLFNGETVSYTLFFMLSVFIFTAVKQFLKIFIGISAEISILTAFVICEIIMYLFERKFVFKKEILSSNLKQIFMLIFRAGVNFGFYKLSDALFGSVLKMQGIFVWLVAVTIAFFFNYFFDRTILFDCAYDAKNLNNTRIYTIFYKYRFSLFSAFLAGVCLAMIYIIYTVFPFGDNTIMRMDLYHQYGPLFAELYDRIVNHQSLIYSWTSGGGSSFLGNYFNYLSSPLSFLILLFDKADISFAITFIVSVKCLLSASSFTLYLQKSQGGKSYLTAVFGVFYAFCAYFLAYYWNVMWLDGMILLPLIALGIERIVNTGSGKIYVISLVLLFFASYYMGFMCCIFAVFYFITYYCIKSKPGDKINSSLTFDKKFSFKALMNNKFFNRGFRFAVFSIVSGGICAVTLIPVFFILKSCSATSDSFPTSFESYFNIFDFVTSHLAGLETTIRSSGDDVLPNVYSGMLAAVLLPLFIANKKIGGKEKLCYTLLLLFFLFSFDNNCLNFIWHAFHFPNDLPFRFSYMYSFILLIIGYKALIKIRAFEIKDIVFVGMAWIFFICVAQKLSTTKMLETTIYTSIAFIILWCVYLCLVKNGKADKMIISALAVVLCFSEVLISDIQAILITQDNASYKKNYSTYTEAIDKIKEDDDSFYREELCYLETRMDPCYYGYNGMSTFSSMAYEDYSQLQYSLGMFGNRINSYTYNTQTPVYNMMFGVKYLIQTDISIAPSSNLYDYKFSTSDENANVYENRYYLPIVYGASENVGLWNTTEGDPFDVQNEYFSLATGYDNVFIPVKYTDTSYDNISGSDIVENGNYWFEKYSENSSYGYADITISPTKDGNVYLYITSPDITSIEVNSDTVSSHTQNIEEPYILDLGFYKSGEEIKVTLDCGTADTDECYADIYAYSLDEEVFKAGYNLLKESAMNITKYSDTRLEGEIVINENSYLYSSIPYDEGWSIYIDGEKAETFEIGSAMLGTTIKPGTHTVEYKYTPKGIGYGLLISAVTIAGAAGYLVYNKMKSRKKLADNISS
ncbi:MAG: YfhO family protein [Clostridium sp.]|nr:YfhO family protein [Clostridium sp.]